MWPEHKCKNICTQTDFILSEYGTTHSCVYQYIQELQTSGQIIEFHDKSVVTKTHTSIPEFGDTFSLIENSNNYITVVENIILEASKHNIIAVDKNIILDASERNDNTVDENIILDASYPNVFATLELQEITHTNDINVSDGAHTIENISTTKLPNIKNIISNFEKLIFCIYCKRKVKKFARHLESKHKCETKVKEFLKLPKRNAIRLSIIKELRCLGAFTYNTDESVNEGDIIVARRSFSTSTKNDYVACPKCNNFFSKILLYRHYRKCGNVPSNQRTPRNLQALSRITTLGNKEQQYEKLQKNVLPGMIHDKVYEVIEHDKVLLLYGNYLCQKHDGDNHLFNMIRHKLRQLANVLIAMRDIDPNVTDLESILHPNLYDKFIAAIRKCRGCNESDGLYRVPSLVSTLGYSMKECAEKVIVECIKNNNSTLRVDVEAWIFLYKQEFPVISKRTNAVIIRRQWNKPRLIPLTADILKLNLYLKKNWKHAFQTMNTGFDSTSWNQLSKSTLLLILIFNRKRVGEMERLLITDYNKKHNIQKDSETYNSLTPSEQLFSQRYVRVEIRGKLGRPISLISHEETEAIDLIIRYRSFANVHHENPYVFGRGVDKYFEGARSLREAANICDSKQPGLLRGTKLRKHIATVSQALYLTENELAILADYIGHNIDIHRHFYRLPNEAIHLVKISKLLVALDSDNIDAYKGKSLDEIRIEENEDIDEASVCEDSSQKEKMTQEDEINIHEEPQTSFSMSDAANICKLNGIETEMAHSATHQNSSDVNNTDRNESHYSSDEESWKPDNEDRDTEYSSHMTPEKPKATGQYKRRYENNTDKESWTPDRKRKKMSRVSSSKTPWSTPEKYAMRSFFTENLKNKSLPSLLQCQRAIKKNSV